MTTSANTLPVKDFYESLSAEDKKSFRENVRVASGMFCCSGINKYVNKRCYGVALKN